MSTALTLLGLLLLVAGLIWLVDLHWQQTDLEMTELERTLDAIDDIDAVAIAARSAMLQEALKSEKEQNRDRR